MGTWNVDSLKAYVDSLRAADLAALQAALATAEKAVLVASGESKDRLTSHNGLIAQMEKLQATFATRDALADLKEAMDRRLVAAERFQAKITGALILVGAIGVANLVKVWTA